MKKAFSYPIYFIIALAVLILGYLGGVTSYFYFQQWYLNYTYNSIEQEFYEQFPNGEIPQELFDDLDN